MKKKLALLLSAIMVATMVPMTAFAVTTNEINKVVTGKADAPITGPVLTIKEKNLSEEQTATFKLTLTNAEWNLAGVTVGGGAADYPGAEIVTSGTPATPGQVVIELLSATQAIVVVDEGSTNIDLLRLPLNATLKGEGDATVTIDPMSSVVSSGTYKFANVVGGSTSTTVEKKVDITESGTVLKPIVITEATTGTLNLTGTNKTIRVKLTNGFAFDGTAPNVVVYPSTATATVTPAIANGDQEFELVLGGTASEPITISISGLKVKYDEDDVEIGDICEATVSGAGMTKQTIEVGTAVTYGVSITAENKTLPTFVAGRTSGSDDTLKVTFKETVQGSWLDSRKTTMTLPEGVKVNTTQGGTLTLTDVKGGLTITGTVDQKANNSVVTFTTTGARSAAVEFKFKFPVSVAPDFKGDIVATFGGAGIEDDVEVVLGTVVAPVTVEADTNKVKIDYRNVAIGDIIIKETDAGNLKKGTTLFLDIENMSFDGTPKVEVVEGDIKIDKVNVTGGRLEITIKTASQKTPAVLKVTGNELYLGRSIPAGKYELSLVYAGAGNTSTSQKLVYVGITTGNEITGTTWASLPATGTAGVDNDKDEFVAMYKTVTSTGSSYDSIFQNYADPAKSTTGFDIDEVVVLDNFVEVVTAGRDQDDSTFTTQLSVAIGADKLIVGDKEIALDVPAYISEGYTMLPVRAITEALSGTAIVRWDDATKTVTLTFGTRVVSMTVGSKTMNINGVSVQMSKACEITGERAFIPLRDLGYALGLNDSKINWDDETKTATLN